VTPTACLRATALLLSIGFAPPPAAPPSIAGLWSTPSRLTPSQASTVLLRQALGETVRAGDLFEAEKYLRTDGGVSHSAYVVGDVLTRLLHERLRGQAEAVRVRTLPPVLQWLDSTTGTGSIRLRGESVQLAVLNDRRDQAVTLLYHRTILQDWRLCDGAPCFSPVPAPLRSGVTYVLSASPAAILAATRSVDLVFASDLSGWLFGSAVPTEAGIDDLGGPCDPSPSRIARSQESFSTVSYRHEARETAEGQTNQILCSFAATSAGSAARFTYLVSDTVAAPPASASRSAVRNNPLAFALFEPAD